MHLSLFVLLVLVVVAESQYIAQTVAGNNEKVQNGNSGDGSFAIFAQLTEPRGVAIDASGNIFIADTKEHRIRFVNKTSGIISTIAGTGSLGFSGDGDLAVRGNLNGPFSVAVDNDGNLYISDTGNNVIRLVTMSTGIISTVAGTGQTGGFGGDGGLAIRAKLNTPRGIRVDSLKNIYIADQANHIIRFVNRAGIISTIAGKPKEGKQASGDGGLATDATIFNPFDVCVDSLFNIYIADSSNNVIRFVNKTSGIISTIAGTGEQAYTGDGLLAKKAVLSYPNGVAVDSKFNVYISDTANGVIRFINKTTNIISTIGGNSTKGYSGDGGVGKFATFGQLFGIDIDSRGNVYVADTQNYVIRALIKTSDGISFHCNNHGTSIAVNECKCDPGWTGVQCNNPICFGISANETAACSGKGKCLFPDMCHCDTGKLGSNCQYFSCNRISSSESSLVCSGRGACVGVDNCTCAVNYFGNYCGQTTCFGKNSTSDTVCSGRGRCLSYNTCTCDTGYNGTKCELTSCGSIPSSSPNVCSGHGSCSSFDNCTCINGYIGSNCEWHTCNGLASNDLNVCSKHGQCSSIDNCTCETGYYNPACSSFDCNGIKFSEARCENNGTCSRPGQCSCIDGFGGDRCEYPICYGVNAGNVAVCSSHGNCSSPNKCKCESEWGGLACNITECHGIDSFDGGVCSGHGECVKKNVCACNYGYTGDNCEFTVCFGINGNETKSCSSRGYCVLPDTCQCLSGYNGEACQHYEVFMDPDTVSIYSSHSNIMNELTSDSLSCYEIIQESDIWKLGDSASRKCYFRRNTGFRIYLGFNHSITNGLVLPILERRFTIKVNSSYSNLKRVDQGLGNNIGKSLDLYPMNKDLLVRSDSNVYYHNFREIKQVWSCSSCSMEIQSILSRNVNKPMFIIPSTNISHLQSTTDGEKELSLSSNSNNDLQIMSSSSRRYIFSRSDNIPVMFNIWNEVKLENFVQDCVGHNCIIESSINGMNTSLTYTFNGFLVVLSRAFQDKQIFRIVNKFGSRLLENNYKGNMQAVGLNLISFSSSFYQVDLTLTTYDNIDVFLTNSNKSYSKDSDIEIGTSIVDPFVYNFSPIDDFSYRWSCQNTHSMQWVRACNVSHSTLNLIAGDLSVGFYRIVLYLTTSKSQYSFYSSLQITEFPQTVPFIVIRKHVPAIYPWGSSFSVKLSIFSETMITSLDWVLVEGVFQTHDVQSLLASSTTKQSLYGHNIGLELNIDPIHLIEGERYCFKLVASNEFGISIANISTVMDIAPRFLCDIYDPLGEQFAFLSKFVIHCVNTKESISSWWIEASDDNNRLTILSNTGKRSFITRLPFSSSGYLNIGIKLINKNGSFSRMTKNIQIKYPILEQSSTARVSFIVRNSKIISVNEPISTDTSIAIASLLSLIEQQDVSQLDVNLRNAFKNSLLNMISSLKIIQDISLNVDDKIIQLVLPPLTKAIVLIETLSPNIITASNLAQWIQWVIKGVRSSTDYYTPYIMSHLLDETHTKEIEQLFQILLTKSSVSSFEILPQLLNIVNEYGSVTNSTVHLTDGGEGYYQEIIHFQQLEGKKINFEQNKNVVIEFPLGISKDLNQFSTTSDLKLITYIYGTSQEQMPSLLTPPISLSLISIEDNFKVENLNSPIRIKFKELHTKNNVTCVYYDATTQQWLSGGIVSEYNIIKVESGIIYFELTCHTSHLSSFSVQHIIPLNTTNSPIPDHTTLTLILSIAIPFSVLLAISLLIITICLIVSFYRTSYWNKRIKTEKEMEKKLLEIELEMNENTNKKHISHMIPVEELQLMKKIGEGGFGQVYLAKWKQVQVAVKSVGNNIGMTLADVEDDEDDLFEKEVLLLNSLKHPNVIHFFGVCLTETKKLMIMEYLEGGSLDKIIAELRLKRRKMIFGDKIKILFGVSNGMSYLHNLKPKSIIHRDLKTANILLDKYMQPKVCDFGLSKLTGNNNSTKMTTNLGSIFYMAPELIGEGGEAITNKLDIYSYGIIMYELLFEDNAFLNQSSQKINRFSQSEITEINSFSVPIKVSKGFRPKIPYSNRMEQEIWISEFMNEERFQKRDLCLLMDKYILLMKQCWDIEPAIRPSFDKIGQYLADMMMEFNI